MQFFIDLGEQILTTAVIWSPTGSGLESSLQQPAAPVTTPREEHSLKASVSPHPFGELRSSHARASATLPQGSAARPPGTMKSAGKDEKAAVAAATNDKMVQVLDDLKFEFRLQA